MATRRNYDEDYAPYRRSSAPAWALVMITLLCAAAFLVFLWPDLAHGPGVPERVQGGAVGNQAPQDVRGTLRGSDTPKPDAAQPAIDAYNAAEQQRADALSQSVAPVATPPPLPLNSAGEPVISQEQQAQQQLSLQLAEQEGAAAADQQLAAQRAAANADAAQRAPDVSYADAAAELHRDPCHVPRANPATCASGLYKPTPVNVP